MSRCQRVNNFEKSVRDHLISKVSIRFTDEVCLTDEVKDAPMTY